MSQEKMEYLPKEFLIRMREMLGAEYNDFYESYNQERSFGLRVNPLKGTREEFLRKVSFSLTPILWEENGFYYNEEERPGRNPYHDAGVYYIQEPSAMAVGALAQAKAGEKVLDLCAAPGGKTTHLAGQMKGEGLLVTNEIHPARAKILSQNVERLGIRNAVVTNEDSSSLAQRFPLFFDRIVVDAPCSGEGMFRKDEIACREWSLQNVALCEARQREILDNAAKMLKVGGRLVYSTCTFAPEENEQQISAFLERHTEFIIEPEVDYERYYQFGFSEGRLKDEKTRKTFRIFPHRVKGEGHFLAVLRKIEGEEIKEPHPILGCKDKKALLEWEDFAKSMGISFSDGVYEFFGDQLYLVPKEMIDMKGLKVLRAGLHLGTLKKNRFEPSHSLALALSPKDVMQSVSFTSDSREILSYLKGETLNLEKQQPKKGWNLVCVDGYSIGWGKVNQGILKNHYPKGLRWLV